MPEWIQFDRLIGNLQTLGAARLLALGLAGISIVLTVIIGSHYLSTPDMETLYSGLTAQDSGRIGETLAEEAMAFEISADGSRVLVQPKDISRARMLLAEKGLPASAGSGYELFDKLGSMSLTTFMQEVTRVRALEGELARTIQTIRGVRAARVHIVIPDRGSFRRERDKPSASVVIKTDAEFASAKAIRHLVAASIPGLGIEQVQVVSTDGSILAADGDGPDGAPSRVFELERTVSNELREKIKRTLAPYLGVDHFEISVDARVNADKRQTSETAFDPKSRVERSVKVLRQMDNAQNEANKGAVSAGQNIPDESADAAAGETSKRSNERREELTNYEINTKQTTTESQGYRVERLSVAVLVNRQRLVEAAGAPVVGGALDAKLKELENLIKSSAGIDPARGDQITLAAVEFKAGSSELEAAVGRSLGDLLLDHAGSMIRSVTILAMVALLVFLGVRPLTRAMQESLPPQLAIAGAAGEAGGVALEAVKEEPGVASLPAPEDDDGVGDLAKSAGRSIQKRLEKIVEFDEAQAAQIIKQWLNQARG